MPAGDPLDELVHELGPLAVLGPADDLTAYETPARGAPGPAAAVVRPASTDEVRVVVRWARRHRRRLLPQGANSGLVGASTPPPVPAADRAVVAPVVLSTERLVDGLVLDPVDRTAVVPAGLRLSQLNAAAAPHGLELPIDLGSDPCLGGMAATNTGGARMLRHGDMRRQVLGLEAVLADDDVSVLDTLRTLRKDNTGADPAALLIGSSGAFGIITQVAVDLQPRPAERACLLAATTPDDAIRLLLDAEHRLGTMLSAFEVLSGEAVDAAATVHGVRVPLHPGPDRVLVLAEAAGTGGCEDAVVGLAAAAATPFEGIVVPPADAWALRHAVTEGLRRRGVVVGFDVSVPRPSLPRLRTLVRSRVAEFDPEVVVADFGHWGDGGVHMNLVFPGERPPGAELRRAAADLVFGTAVDDLGGSFSAEHGIGPHNVDWWRRTTSPAARTLLSAAKRAADPRGVLGHPALPY
ncbi:MAG: FAD-binding oxidoreductase [Microthrixaceae bacterium]